MILSIIGGIILSLVGIYIFKLFVSYKGLDYYRKQGVETKFYPLLGFFNVFFLSPKIKD